MAAIGEPYEIVSIMEGIEERYPPKRLTFGMELEMLLPVLIEGTQDPLKKSSKGLVPVLRVKRPDDGILYLAEVEEEAQQNIIKLFRRHGIPTGDKGGGPSNLIRIKAHGTWKVKEDGSIMDSVDQSDVDTNLRAKGYRHVIGVELVSPVEYTTDAAFKSVEYALSLLLSTYRVFFNPSCGLHVHVGLGSNYFPLENLRRISTLLYAADPLLATLHPPWRRYNTYTQSIRQSSELSHGEEPKDVQHAQDGLCRRYYGASVRFGENFHSWREVYKSPDIIDNFEQTRRPGHYEPFYIKNPKEKQDSPNNEQGTADPTSDNAEDLEVDLDAEMENLMSRVSLNDEETDASESIAARHRTSPRVYIPAPTRKDLRDYLELLDKFGVQNVIDADDLNSPVIKTSNIFSAETAQTAWTTARTEVPEATAPTESSSSSDEVIMTPKSGQSEASGSDVPIRVGPYGPVAPLSECTGVFPGTARIYSKVSSCEIFALFSKYTRANYNHQAYWCDNIVHNSHKDPSPRTIEFREAEGTGDIQFILNWIRIAAGVINFAMNTSPMEYSKVLINCDRAARETASPSYDVVDFLDEVGLFAEAAFCEKRLREKSEVWGLKFAE